MVASDFYVDPSIDAASGSGTIGDPYGDLQHALDSATRNTTDWNRFHVKAGTAEVLTGALDFSTFGSFTWNGSCGIFGYTSTAFDGGIGEINCNGNSCTTETGSTPYGFMLMNMKVRNSGANIMFNKLPRSTTLYNCEFTDCNANCVLGYSVIKMYGCHLHNISGIAVTTTAGSRIIGNYFKNDGTYDMSLCIQTSSTSHYIAFNIISVDGATNGMNTGDGISDCSNNSLLSSGGTGYGIDIGRGYENVLYDNIVEGFSGVGGVGIDQNSGEELTIDVNSYYNNSSNRTGFTSAGYYELDSLGSSGFAKSGADSFANRFAYFEPQDVGNVLSGLYGGVRGAVPQAASAGGGGGCPVIMTSG